MKPVMWLDDSMPLTQSVPTKADGTVDSKLFIQLQILATQYRYHNAEEETEAQQWKVEYHRLKEGVQFRDEPVVIQHFFACGKLAPPIPDRQYFSTHPSNWEKLPEESKAKYEAIPKPVFKLS